VGTGHILENNIRTHVKEVVRKDVDWIHRTENKDQWRVLVNTVLNFRVP
jgi:hypothetical protein